MLGAGVPSAKRVAPADELPADLKVGTWVGIRDKGENVRRSSARLSYISSLKTRYLFVDRHGKASLDCSRAELARRFRDREVVIMDELPEDHSTIIPRAVTWTARSSSHPAAGSCAPTPLLTSSST